MLFRDLQDELREAGRQSAVRERAETTAAQFQPSMFANLVQNYEANPNLPPDAQIAVALEPGAGQGLFANLSRAHAEMRAEPAIGEVVRPSVQRAGMPVRRGGMVSKDQEKALGAALQIQQQSAADRVDSGSSSLFGRIADSAYEGVKGVVRNTMPVLDVGQQLVQASGRQAVSGGQELLRGNFANADALFRASTTLDLQDVRQTDAFQLGAERLRAAGQFVTGQEVTAGQDLGNGFFLNQESAVVQRRMAAEREMGVLPNGQTITIGRGAATFAGLDPEGAAYNVLSGLVDATVALSAPGPEGALANQLYRVRAPAARFFGAVSESEYMSTVGAFRGVRTHVDLDRAREFLFSDRATGLVDNIVGETSWARLDALTNGELKPETVTALVEASDPDAVRQLLVQAVEFGERPTMPSAFGQVAQRVNSSLRTGGWSGYVHRLTGDVPDQVIDLRDGRSAVNTIRDYATNVNMSGEVADRWVEMMGRASNHVERRDAYAQVLAETAEKLAGVSDESYEAMRVAARGAAPNSREVRAFEAATQARERARELTRYTRTELDTTRATLDDMLEVDATDFARGLIETQYGPRLPGVTLLSEMAEQLPLPDVRELRRATGVFRPLWEAGQGPDAAFLERALGESWRTVALRIPSGFNRVFKDTRLLRLGYPLRVIPEERLRMIVRGVSSGMSHPFGPIGAVLDRRVGDPVEAVASWRRLFEDVDEIPAPLADDLVSLDGPSPSGIRGLAGDELTDDDYYAAALADTRLGGLRENGVQAGRPGKLDTFAMRDAGGEFRDDALQVWRDQLTTMAADPIVSRLSRKGVDETLQELAGGSAPGVRLREKLIGYDERMADDAFLREYLEMVSRRVEGLTGGSDDLMAMLRTGRKPSVAELRTLGEFAPETVVGRGYVLDPKMENAYNRMTNAMFEVLATKPTNRLSRSPAFLEFYEQKIVELAPLAANRAEFLAAARKANVRQSTMEILEQVTTGGGKLPVTTIDELARVKSLDEVQDLLYDVGRNSQFFDQLRVVFPFGEAWKEVITTWAGLASRDPFTIIRRGGQAVEAAQSNDFAQVYFDATGLEQQAQTGFFYENQYGDQVFYLPWSADLSETFTGMPWRMEATARSLNIAGELMPGLGPLAAVPAHHLLPKGSEYNSLRERIFPFGPPRDLRDISGWVMPNWLDTMINKSSGFTQEQERLYGNTQWQVARYLYSKDPERYAGPNGAQLLDEESRPITRNLFLTRAMLQATSPAAPLISSNIVGENGELVDQAVVADAYLRFLEEDYETALLRTLELYGSGSVLVSQGNTASTVYGGTPLEGAGYDWVKDNPGVAREHPQLYGFFAPLGDGSDFSREAYHNTLDTGERVQLTLDQKFRLAQHRHASAIYRTYRDQIEGSPNATQRAQLAAIRQELREQLPGYDNVGDIVGNRADVVRVIQGGDVDRALEDPLLRETEAGQALAAYWDFRAGVLEQAAAAGFDMNSDGGWRTSNEGAPYRDALRSAGEEVVQQVPEFARMWDLFLSREFEDEQ